MVSDHIFADHWTFWFLILLIVMDSDLFIVIQNV